jgi:hypothetical protein
MGTRLERSNGLIGDRIAFAWQDRGTESEQLRVTISQGTTASNMAMLSIWMVMWLCLEAAVLYFWLQGSSEGNAAVGYAIYSAFWAFFAFRIGKVWLWRVRGSEVIVIDRRGISVAMVFGQRGLPDFFAHGAYKGLSRVEENPAQILRTFEQAFWSMGGETLKFSGGKRTMVFGKQLTDRDADGLLRLMRPAAQRLERKIESA